MTWAEEQMAWALSLATEHGARVIRPLEDEGVGVVKPGE